MDFASPLSNRDQKRCDLPRYTVSKKLLEQGSMKIQALRSASHWSIGLDTKENSIYECYLEMISTAQHYIYLENQFFMSSYSADNAAEEANETDIVRNRIAKALYSRILKAHQNKQNFKVYIFIPCLPAAERNFKEEEEGNLLKMLMYQQNCTLGLAAHSLIEMIKNNITRNYEEYLMVSSLRKYEEIPSYLRDKNPSLSDWAFTELVYIHSKVGFLHRRS